MTNTHVSKSVSWQVFQIAAFRTGVIMSLLGAIILSRASISNAVIGYGGSRALAIYNVLYPVIVGLVGVVMIVSASKQSEHAIKWLRVAGYCALLYFACSALSFLRLSPAFSPERLNLVPYYSGAAYYVMLILADMWPLCIFMAMRSWHFHFLTIVYVCLMFTWLLLYSIFPISPTGMQTTRVFMSYIMRLFALLCCARIFYNAKTRVSILQRLRRN